MDSLLQCIVKEITRQYRRLSVISNPDGFLRRKDTICAMKEQADITVLSFSQLELRVWFETVFKEDTANRFVVLMDDTTKLVADIYNQAFVTVFKTRDLLLTYNQQAIDLNKITYQMMAHLFENKSVALMDRQKTISVMESAEIMYGKDGEDISIVKQNLMGIVIDWQKPLQTIEQISKQIVKAVKQGKYKELEPEIAYINQSFQQHLNARYRQLITATGPRVVHKILAHIERTYSIGSKVALVVVDGLSYWQYTILEEYFADEGIVAHNGVCHAWIPSVTQQSRQAIFRGAAPERNYIQNTSNEKKLWYNYWCSRNYEDFHVKYVYENLPDIPHEVERLAFVTMTVDDDMHSAHSMKQLYNDTEEWTKNFVKTLKSIIDKGFEIILTADHGGVPSYSWGNLSQHEKAALYETGSRGHRHLIFNNLATQDNFVKSHPDIIEQWMVYGDSVDWRDNKCFGTADCISHGGSHVLEMLVPLATLKKQV